MKTIFIQSNNNKLFSNIGITKNNKFNIIRGEITNNIYQIFYSLNFEALIMNLGENIDNSVIQFAIEFPDKNIFIYDQQSKIDTSDISSIKNIKIIVDNKQSKTIKDDNVISINQNMLNDQLYGKKNNFQKQNYCACFLDNMQIIPQRLMSQLYPNSHHKIRMFNNSSIQHIQNLGIITEKDRAEILKEAQYYIPLNDKYELEAHLSGCTILNLEDMKEIKYEIPKYETYNSFLEQYL